MNKKEYAKLIIEVTTVATKAKLLLEQIKQTTALRQSEFEKSDSKIASVENILTDVDPAADKDKELQAAINVHRNSLRKLSWDLKTSIETPVNNFKRQAENIKKTFVEKIVSHPGLAEESAEFDLSNIHEQIDQTKTALDIIDAELISVLSKLHQTQDHINILEKNVSDLSLSYDVKRATEKATQLHKKCCDIESTLSRNPELRDKVSGFTPLRHAIENLSLHQRTLWHEAAAAVGKTPVTAEPSIARSDMLDSTNERDHNTDANSDSSIDNATVTPRNSARLSMS